MKQVKITVNTRTAKALSAVASFYEVNHVATEGSRRFVSEVRRVATAVKAAQRRAK